MKMNFRHHDVQHFITIKTNTMKTDAKIHVFMLYNIFLKHYFSGLTKF